MTQEKMTSSKETNKNRDDILNEQLALDSIPLVWIDVYLDNMIDKRNAGKETHSESWYIAKTNEISGIIKLIQAFKAQKRSNYKIDKERGII